MGHVSTQSPKALRPLSDVAPATGQRVSRVLAETGLSLGVGFATDAIYKSAARSGKGVALVVGLAAASGMKAGGETLLDATMGAEGGRSRGEAALDGLRTGLIDGSLAIGARRLHQGVAAKIPNARPFVQTAVTGSTLGAIGGVAYSATDHRTWQHGAAEGLKSVGKSTAYGAAGGFVMGGTVGYVAPKVTGMLRALRRPPVVSEPVIPTKPTVEPVAKVEPVVQPKVQTAVTGKTAVKATVATETTTSPKLTRQERIAQYQKTAVTGAVSEGAATSQVAKTTTVAKGQTSVGAATTKALKSESPAFKGDAYHPDVVEQRIAHWQKVYGANAVTGATRLTKPQAIAAADKLGYELTNYSSHGQPVFRNGNRYITPDVDSHNGGVWKMAASPEELGSKTTRLGTYDGELNRIGD